MNYFKVTNWERFQHYKDRNPPWIKLHYELMSSMDWVTLADASRVLAVACMLIASRNDGCVPDDPDYIKRVAYLNKTPDFKPLVSCGFLTDYDRTLADASTMQADACSESEAETDSYLGAKAKKDDSVVIEATEAMVKEWNDAYGASRGRTNSLVKAIKAVLSAEPGTTPEDFRLVVKSRLTEDWVVKDRPPLERMIRVENFSGNLEKAKELDQNTRSSKAPADVRKMFEEINGGTN